MSAIYVEAIEEFPPLIHPDILFLAGGISGCEDWQSEAVHALKNLPITIVNPRRKKFDISDATQTQAQIAWEFKMLRHASHVAFWFSDKTIQPIVLFELGAAMERNTQKLFIGTHPNYPRVEDVKAQCRLKNPNMAINSDFEGLMMSVRNPFELRKLRQEMLERSKNKSLRQGGIFQ